jgi:hypothetical protein
MTHSTIKTKNNKKYFTQNQYFIIFFQKNFCYGIYYDKKYIFAVPFERVEGAVDTAGKF